MTDSCASLSDPGLSALSMVGRASGTHRRRDVLLPLLRARVVAQVVPATRRWITCLPLRRDGLDVRPASEFFRTGDRGKRTGSRPRPTACRHCRGQGTGRRIVEQAWCRPGFDGAYERAIDAFTEAIRLQPDYVLAYNNAATPRSPERLRAGHRGLRPGPHLDPCCAAAYSNRALAHARGRL